MGTPVHRTICTFETVRDQAIRLQKGLKTEATPTNRLFDLETGLATNCESVERVPWGRR